MSETEQAQELEGEVVDSVVSEQSLAVAQEYKPLAVGGLKFKDDDSYLCAIRDKAAAIADMVKKSNCVEVIQGRDYVKVVGWEMLAQMCGARAIVTKIEPQDDGSFLASAELRATDDRLLQTAQMLCGDRTDKLWANRPLYAKLSMVQTRVKGKVCRMEFAPLMAMGGYADTPAEEMEAQRTMGENLALETCALNGASVQAIIDGLERWEKKQDQDGMESAAIAWDELSDDIKMILFKGTRKRGGVFTSAEKKIMHSTEFRLLRPSTQEAMAKEQGERDEWDAAYDAAEADKESQS